MGLVKTVVYHISEQPTWIHMPDPAGVYQQIFEANKGWADQVLVYADYAGHENWQAEAEWIAQNLQGIPLMVDVAGAWPHHTTPQELEELMNQPGMDVRWIRITELVSYYMHLGLPFPTDYVLGMLEFCLQKGLKVYWCEWKVDYALGMPWEVRVFDFIKEVIEGYEDIVTVGFKTNSGDLEPAAGFEHIKKFGFVNVGATVEAWYWETRHRPQDWTPEMDFANPEDMPVSWMIVHVHEALDAGMELIQFEPYWYFFEHTTGKQNPYLKILTDYVKTGVAGMEPASVILQTLKAEWTHGPDRDEVAWLDGRASTVVGYDVQPSVYDFNKLPGKYAVCAYGLGGSSLNRNVWLRTETVVFEVLVKTLGSTLDRAVLVREQMRSEVERIINMYSKIGGLWDPTPGPTGARKYRRIPGIYDVVVSQETGKGEDSKVAKVGLHVRCKIIPRKVRI